METLLIQQKSKLKIGLGPKSKSSLENKFECICNDSLLMYDIAHCTMRV